MILDGLNNKLSNINQYFTLKNIAFGTAAAVAIVCTWKKLKVMWLQNEARKLASSGQRQIPQQAPQQPHGMGNAMVVGPMPDMQAYAAYMKQRQTQVPQQVPQRAPQPTTTPPQRMPETGWEANELHRHIEKLKADNRRLKAQAHGFPSMEMPDSVDEKGNPVYFEE